MAKYRRVSGYDLYRQDAVHIENTREEDFTFGETNALSTRLLLQDLDVMEDSVIYDLGSGRGIFLLSAHFMYGIRGVGVEIIKTYSDKCLEICRSMRVGGVLFRNENITHTDLSDADIIYLSGATFSEGIIDTLTEKFCSLEPGVIIIIIRHKLPEEHFVLFQEGKYPFTWGTDQVYFYRKK